MPWLLKYSFLATPKLFFISQTLANKPFIRRPDADCIGPKIENSTLARVTVFSSCLAHALQEQTNKMPLDSAGFQVTS